MATKPPRYTYLQAGWIVPVGRPAVRNGCVVIDTESGTISDVTSSPPADMPPISGNYETCIVTPGLINAHCHLELSHLHAGRGPTNRYSRFTPIRVPGASAGKSTRTVRHNGASCGRFPRRLRSRLGLAQPEYVRGGRLTKMYISSSAYTRSHTASRLGLPGSASTSETTLQQCGYTADFRGWLVQLMARRGSDDQAVRARRQGLRACLGGGTTMVVDICSRAACAGMTLPEDAPRVIACAEAIGIGVRRADAAARVQELLDAGARHTAATDRQEWGLAPHGPYSTADEVYQHCIDLCHRRHMALTTHLAETREELQFVHDARGPLMDLLWTLGIVDESIRPRGMGCIRWALDVGLLDQDFPVLLAHCNYLDDNDIQILATSRAAVVYCPQSHDYFGHPPHRLPELLDAGVLCCLGTDSLASADSLSMLDQMRAVRRQFPQLSAHTILELATCKAATALGRSEQFGTLERGKVADLAVFRLDASAMDTPLESLLHAQPIQADRTDETQSEAITIIDGHIKEC